MSASVPPAAPVTDSLHVPPHAARLAYAGLLPFAAGAVLAWVGLQPVEVHEFVVLALLAYASLVVGFLAGIHWGVLMRHARATPAEYVVPLLLWGGAWVALVMPPHAGLVVAGALLVGTYLVDRRRYPALGLGHWLTLRFRLSLGAAFCCFLAAANV